MKKIKLIWTLLWPRNAFNSIVKTRRIILTLAKKSLKIRMEQFLYGSSCFVRRMFLSHPNNQAEMTFLLLLHLFQQIQLLILVFRLSLFQTEVTGLLVDWETEFGQNQAIGIQKMQGIVEFICTKIITYLHLFKDSN